MSAPTPENAKIPEKSKLIQGPIMRLREVPLRYLVPNLVTLFALCSGLTAIRLALEGRLELALLAIVFAALLDALDGRLARLLKGTSRFGAELDSLTDFVNFGVVPALILYFWLLKELRHFGWIAALLLAIAAALRLARFNVSLDDPDKPAWSANYFTGIPAPAGALSVLLPIYIEFIGVPHSGIPPVLVMLYTLLIAFLMVSRIPTFSGKKLGLSVRRDWVVLVFFGIAAFVALLVAYTWEVLTAVTLIYLALIPVSARKYAQAAQQEQAQKKDA